MSARRTGSPGLSLGPARRDARPTGRPLPKTAAVPRSSKWDGEVVPDSEEERTRGPDVIEIQSSDEEDQIPRHKVRSGDPARIPGAWPAVTRASPARTIQKTPATRDSHASPLGTTRRQTPVTPTSKTIVTSARPRATAKRSADATADEVVVLADPEGLVTPKSKVPAKHFYKSTTPRTPSPSKAGRSSHHIIEPSDTSDSEIEVLGTPVQYRDTRVQRPGKEKAKPLYEDDSSPESTSTLDSKSSFDSSIPAHHRPDKYAKYWTPSMSSASKVKAATPSKASASKALELPLPARLKLQQKTRAAEMAVYSEQVYSYLNRVVFGDRLPALGKVELKWNNHMTSSAGRAMFHRDREGNEHAEIHLATKILTDHERIRNTLGHEMCHLASWMIDKVVTEAHGKLFRKWANRVEKKDCVITISIQHTYEIDYPFQWSSSISFAYGISTHFCADCSYCPEIIQRFSNSVAEGKPCSKCGIGKFELQEEQYGGQHMRSTTSKLAAAKPQNSPRLAARDSLRLLPHSISTATSIDKDENKILPSVSVQKEIYVVVDSSDEDEDEDEKPLPSLHAQKEIYVVHDSDSETEGIDDLAQKFGGITIQHKVCLHAKSRTRA